MRLARVVGNVVSTVKEQTHYNYKLLIVEYLDGSETLWKRSKLCLTEPTRASAISCWSMWTAARQRCCSGDKEIIADNTACGVVDHWTFDGKVTGK